ncbi:MAG: hypothetical protein J6Y02_03785 [Pseudobutyrivibrio sp.]|nr:hypothetical protein [Pseudobutyrivibrio sp.]
MLFDKQVLAQKAGLSWTQLSKPSGFDSYDCLYYASEDSQGRIYAGGQKGIFYTDNDGVSWVTTNSSRSEGLACLYNDSIVSVTTNGLKISTNRGTTWSNLVSYGNWPLACPLNDDSHAEACIMLAVQKSGSGSNISYKLFAYKFNQSNTLTLDTSEEVNVFYSEPLKMVQCKKVPTANSEYFEPAGNSVIIQTVNMLYAVCQEYSLYSGSPHFRTVDILDNFTLIGNLSNPYYLEMTVHIHDVCVTSTGRIIVLFSRQDATSGITLERYYIAYNDTLDINNWVIPGNSDTVLGNITYNETNDVHARLCTIDNRIMLVCGNSNGWRYSDDDGITWNTYDPTQDITTFGNSKIVGLPSNKIFYAASWQMYLSTPTYATVKELGKHNKYLDQTGANELITQFKAYVDSLV